MNLVPADRYDYARLAELFTRGYAGYLVPMSVDEATMKYMVETWDVDLSRSRVADDVGVCNLAVRGDQGWIAGVGVAPEARRRGVARALMEAVLALAPPTVTLEVLEENDPAIRLYESLGFAPTRTLEIWSVEAPAVEAHRVDPAPLRQRDLPWQRQDRSLPRDYERWEVEGGAMLLRGSSVLQLDARNEAAAATLLSRGTRLHFANVPEGDVASRALRRLGGELTLRQLELRRTA